MMPIDKVLVSNRAALRSKYGAKGLQKIEQAVDTLVTNDAGRGIETRAIYLDRSSDMKPLKAPRVTKSGDRKQVKRAIDGVFEALDPAYLVILDAPDVVPHQSLQNPMRDEDPNVPSDLPYASAVPFSTRPEDFISPSRVVSRLPGIRGEGDPAYLLSLLKSASGWESHGRRSYRSHFAVSAEAWKGSTRKTVTKLFGTTKRLWFSPPDGPAWTRAQLKRRTHFLNLHGALEDENFYGEKDGTYPDAHRAPYLAERVRAGTVAAAECCYGAELYDPEVASRHMGIANTYLGAGAYAFFGSTTVAYGPEDDNGLADVLCQYFVAHVLEGASIGRAALQARQRYVASHSPLGPVDLKTLAQFLLLGDASIHPVRSAKKSAPARTDRRAKLSRRAKRLEKTTGRVECAPKHGASGKLRQKVESVAKAHSMTLERTIERFTILAPQESSTKSESRGSYLLIYGRSNGELPKKLSKSRRRGKSAIANRRPVLVVREEDGKVKEVQKLVPR
jgi:hypothetical protein